MDSSGREGLRRQDGELDGGGRPNILLRRGFTKKSLEVGAEILVEGYRAKNGEAVANGANITFKDGKRLFVGGSAPEEQPQK
jgi:hypothetical protein